MSEPDTADALHVQAQRALLDGLRRGDALSEFERAVRFRDKAEAGGTTGHPAQK